MFSVLEPHLSGSITKEVALSEPGDHRPLNDGSGIKIYTLATGIADKKNGSVEAKQAQGALDAMHELEVIAHNLGTGNVDLVMRASLALGQLIERIPVRAFEPLVKSRLKSDDAIKKRNEKRTASKDLKREAEEAMEIMKAEHPDRVDDTDFIKKKAAGKLGIKKEH